MLNYSKIFKKLKEPQEAPKIKHGTMILNPSHVGGIVFKDTEAEKEFLENYEVDESDIKIENRKDEAVAKVSVKALLELRTQLSKLDREPYRAELMISDSKVRAMVGGTLFEWPAETGDVEAASEFGVRYLSQFLSPLKRGMSDITLRIGEESRVAIETGESVLFLAPAINHDEGRALDRTEPYIEGGKVFYKCDACHKSFWSSKRICPECDMSICVRPGDRQEYNSYKYGGA